MSTVPHVVEQGRPPPRGRWAFAIVAVFLVALVAAAIWWWSQPRMPAAVAPSPAPGSATAPPPPVAAPPAIRYPIESGEQNAAAAEPHDITAALTDLFGQDAVRSIVELDDFPHRLAATVDNLGRSTAGARLRPVRPVPGRFTVEPAAGGDVIAPDNGLRYAPYVLLLENVDLGRMVAVYKRFYPLFQRSYEELGYPHGYFNDRLVEVVDLLLATPEPRGPLKVRLPSFAGATPPARPWVLYEFEDPQLQTLSSGQKLLLRMGAVNERRVKARLTELRKLLTANGTQR